MTLYSFDLTAEEVQTQQQIQMIGSIAINSIDTDALQSLLRKFEMADTILPLIRPSEWLAVSESAPLHIDLVKSFISFRNAAATLRRAVIEHMENPDGQ